MTETQNHKSEEREVGSEVREEGAVEDVVEREIEAEEEEEEDLRSKNFPWRRLPEAHKFLARLVKEDLTREELYRRFEIFCQGIGYPQPSIRTVTTYMKRWKEIAYELENLDRALVTAKKAKSPTEMQGKPSGAQVNKAQQDYDEFVKTIPCFSHFTATEVGQLIVDGRSIHFNGKSKKGTKQSKRKLQEKQDSHQAITHQSTWQRETREEKEERKKKELSEKSEPIRVDVSTPLSSVRQSPLTIDDEEIPTKSLTEMQDQITENKYRIFTKFDSALGGISDAIKNVGALQVQENSVRREWESKRFEAENQNAKSILDFEREKFIASQTLEKKKD